MDNNSKRSSIWKTSGMLILGISIQYLSPYLQIIAVILLFGTLVWCFIEQKKSGKYKIKAYFISFVTVILDLLSVLGHKYLNFNDRLMLL